MGKCVIYANCQGDGLAVFLKLMGFPHETRVFRNYQMILGEQRWEDLEEAARSCDYFIYQPTDDKHDKFASEHILEEFIRPRNVFAISFAYIVNHGFFPLIEHGGKFIGGEFIPDKAFQEPLDYVLAQYDAGRFGFHLRERFVYCLNEQMRREAKTDVKLGGFILERSNRQLMLNYNHPSSPIFDELARQAMELFGYISKNYAPVAINHAGLPCSLPVSAYTMRTWDWDGPASPDSHRYYRHLLEGLWRQRHKS